MENNYLAKILPFLNEIEKDRREQFEQYFRTAPMWLMDTFVVEELEKGTVFVQEGEPADMIFFIGKGLIKATDYRIYGINYDFTVFDKVYAFGGMEVIINLDKYQTTLQTVTECTVLKIPKEGFKKWMESDIRALQQETQNGVLKMKGDRQELSDFTGLCMKTISRSIKKFKENGMITTQGSYITINYEQYRRMKEMISEILAEDL